MARTVARNGCKNGNKDKTLMARRISIDNPRYPHDVLITRLVGSDSPFDDTEEETVVLYEGKGRAFTDTTTTGDKKMDMNRRKCSIPVRFDEWENEVLDGDTITVKVGNIVYSGEVKDCEPDNNRTLVYWERPRVTDM